LVLLTAAQLTALGAALFAVLYGLRFTIVVVTVIAFLILGHYVRNEVARRKAVEREAAEAGEPASAGDDDTAQAAIDDDSVQRDNA